MSALLSWAALIFHTHWRCKVALAFVHAVKLAAVIFDDQHLDLASACIQTYGCTWDSTHRWAVTPCLAACLAVSALNRPGIQHMNRPMMAAMAPQCCTVASQYMLNVLNNSSCHAHQTGSSAATTRVSRHTGTIGLSACAFPAYSHRHASLAVIQVAVR